MCSGRYGSHHWQILSTLIARRPWPRVASGEYYLGRNLFAFEDLASWLRERLLAMSLSSADSAHAQSVVAVCHMSRSRSPSSRVRDAVGIHDSTDDGASPSKSIFKGPRASVAAYSSCAIFYFHDSQLKQQFISVNEPLQGDSYTFHFKDSQVPNSGTLKWSPPTVEGCKLANRLTR